MARLLLFRMSVISKKRSALESDFPLKFCGDFNAGKKRRLVYMRVEDKKCLRDPSNACSPRGSPLAYYTMCYCNPVRKFFAASVSTFV